MSDSLKHDLELPPEQRAIRDKCFHPSGTFLEFPIEDVETSIPARFEKIVRMYPERPAVKMGDRTLTYDELNRYANPIARAILEKRSEGSEPIALLFEHGIDVIAAILGALKAGKLYVPLDPWFPMVRNIDVLEDSEPTVIVTNNDHLPLAKAFAREKLALINIEEIRCSYAVENPNLHLTSDTLANILYTSGTTGKPKGVVQNHRNVLHLVMRHTNRAHILPDDRIAVLRSFNVHGGTLLTLAALLNGAAILPFDTKRQGVHGLAKWLAREEITLCRMGPTLFRHLADMIGEKPHFPKLREISFSGEPLYKNDVELCRQRFSDDCLLVNSFGATEVSSCCEYLVNREGQIKDGVVPCGYPTRDIEILLLEDDGRATPPGEIGEIAVKSRYLALEYWRKPELTRAKFPPIPNGSDERVYLTGDLGRMLPDGLLTHVGRKDFQVKIRGYRVELAEVEATLLAVANIKEAMVVEREDPPLGKRLVAYVVPDKMPGLSTTALRRALGEKLPNYMIPAVFVVLDALPLTPNGKPDRKALPDPGSSRPQLNAPFIPPRTLDEEKLATIWARVLGIDQVGIYDDFFDLGGHSLVATRVVSRMRDSFHVELPLRKFFESPTVSGLAAHIEEARQRPPSLTASPIMPVPFKEECPQSFSQERFWFLNQLEPDSCAYNITHGFRLTGSLNIKAFERTLEEIVRRHEVLRTTFSMRNGELRQVIAEPGSVPLPMVDLAEKPDTDINAASQRFFESEHCRPFNLSSDLMLRATLLRLDANEHVFLFSIHHIAFDHWSIKILHRELTVIYQAFSAERPPPLPKLPIQYKDYAIKQTWTYGELAERADTLARLLRASGLRPGDVVAVHGVRSFGVIASMIGTLLSGGVLLAVDYNLPSERKQLMLREAGAKRLLHVGDSCSREAWLKGDSVPEILFVDPAHGCVVDAGMGLDLTSIILPALLPNDPAYIFFTSGTTGVPKGVLGCHKGLSHFLSWQQETFAIGPTDRVAQLTSLSFDVVLRDIFLPLISGGNLCLPEAIDGLGPDDVIAWLERERISVLHTSPTLAHSWLAAGAEGASLSAMRYVFFAGEPLTEALVRRWRATFAKSDGIVNLYGPTETTLAKCFYRVRAETPYGVQPLGVASAGIPGTGLE